MKTKAPRVTATGTIWVKYRAVAITDYPPSFARPAWPLSRKINGTVYLYSCALLPAAYEKTRGWKRWNSRILPIPYHDWNERVTAECYAPNSASRILRWRRPYFQIVNNYSRISFNFGPTLLSWMEQKSPAVYEAILAPGSRQSAQIFPGTVRPWRRPTTI